MKILHVAEAVPGGVATYLNALLPWQAEQLGAGQVGLLYPKSAQSALSEQLQSQVRLFDYPHSGRNPQSIARLCGAAIGTVAQFKPTVVHAHSSFAGVACRLWPSSPVVYTPHGWAFAMECSRLKKTLFAFIERLLAPRSAATIAVSGYERQIAAKAGVDTRNVRVVHSGLPDHLPAPDRSAERSGPLQLLFVGRFVEEKGLQWLIDALAPLPAGSFELTAVGAPAGSRPLDLSAMSHVRFPGWVAPEQLDDYLDRADVLIVPSSWEAFGFAALEAMRRGVPVVASRRGGLPEVVADTETGLLFDLENPQAFRDMLLGLDRQRLASMGLRGRERYLTHFTADRMCQQMQAVYESVLGSRS